MTLYRPGSRASLHNARRLEQPARSGSGGMLLCARWGLRGQLLRDERDKWAYLADCASPNRLTDSTIEVPVPLAGEIDANLQIPRGDRGIRRGILGVLIGKHGPI